LSQPIAFNKSYFTGRELDYVARAIASGRLSGDGAFTRACQELLEQQLGIHRVLLTPSCTAALEMAAILCEVGPGDEVILPSYTFVSTANAFVLSGARPVFVDIRPDTLNLDEQLVERAMTPRTKVICPVHYAGVACEMDALAALAQQHGVRIVEDAAQGVNAFYGRQALGAIGDLGTFSFHATKNYVCGEGGALCINDPALVERAEMIREKGTNRSKFLRGLVDRYTWVDVGGSHLLGELAAAFLYAQLERLHEIQTRRRAVYKYYDQALRPLAAQRLLQVPAIPEGRKSNYHAFYILVADSKIRDGLLHSFRQAEIQAAFHYVPLHTSPMGQTFGYQAGDLPVTEDCSARMLRLPFHLDLTQAEQSRVVKHLTRYLLRSSRSASIAVA
jgi:dTDP-4-amino-4,6-dideoxygalactose transaminase